MRPRDLIPLHRPALALARWTVLLMGWVWLGAQGQRLGWSLASGVLAVALWWTLRLVGARRAGHAAPARRTLRILGLLTAVGAGGVARADSGPVTFALLIALTASWAAWSVALDACAARTRRCQRPWMGWPPVLAALITWAVLGIPVDQPLTGLPVALMLCGAALLAGAAPAGAGVPDRRSPMRPTAAGGLPETAMGLMMGSLWLGSGWCAGTGWCTQTVVGLHLLVMVAAPGLVRLGLVPRQLPSTAMRTLPLVLVLASGLLLGLEQTPAHGVTGMFLLALAWALPAPVNGPIRHVFVSQQPVRWALLGGPALLVAVGAWSPTLGPQALALAYGGLGVLGGATLLATLARQALTPIHAHPREDAS